MLIVNIILAVALLGFIGAGYKDGLIHSLGRVIGAILAFIAAKSWSLFALPYVAWFIPAAWAKAAAFVLVFLVVHQLVGFIFRLVDGVFQILSAIPGISYLDKILGGALGLVEGVVMIGGATYLILTFKIEPHLVAWMESSIVASQTERVFLLVLGFLV